jgi:hypothetical protein
MRTGTSSSRGMPRSRRENRDKELGDGPNKDGKSNIIAALIGGAATILAALIALLGAFLLSKNDLRPGPVQDPGPGQATPSSPSLPIPREIACRPPMPRSQDPRVQGEVRNLIEATHHICVKHPDGDFDPPEARATVTSFVPSGDGTVLYNVKGDATGYVILSIDGPRDTTGKWSASWQQNSSSDCWSQLIVTGPDGLQRENSTYTDCNPRR